MGSVLDAENTKQSTAIVPTFSSKNVTTPPSNTIIAAAESPHEDVEETGVIVQDSPAELSDNGKSLLSLLSRPCFIFETPLQNKHIHTAKR